MKRLLALMGAVVLAAAGVLAAHAATNATTHTATNCATTTAASHIAAMDGTPVATVGGDTLSVCATVTATDQTVTVTAPASTTTTTSPGTTTTPPPPPPTYLFDDEFNGAAGSKPSTTLWNAHTSSNAIRTWDGWNAVSENGSGDLVITATKNSGIWDTGFISGKIGYSGVRHVEARVKLPCGYGTWAGVWEWGAPYGAAPSLEDDIAEQLGKSPSIYYTTLHYWDSSGDHSSGSYSVNTGVTLCNAFHTYAANVYADHVDYYFDGAYVSTRTASSIGLSNLTTWSDVADLSLDMGGSWACPSSDTTDCTSNYSPKMAGPVSMLVDYVRVSALS